MIPGYQALQHAMARQRLTGSEFSIISNNCWGAHVYQALGLPFTTPFIGLFLSPASYLRLLAVFPQRLASPLAFKSVSDEAWINHVRDAHPVRWPVGDLGDGIEIQFMHYRSEAEAGATWARRCARITNQPDRWFFKFCDRDGCTSEQMAVFDQLPFHNKVLFTTRLDCPARCAVRIPIHEPTVPDGLALSRISPRCFDTADWLNGGTGRVKWWGRGVNCI